MKSLNKATGLRITLPDNVNLTDSSTAPKRRREQLPPSGTVPLSSSSTSAESDTIISAMKNEEMNLVDSSELEISPRL